MKKVLHFTLGPVQSFVEQARRTRDLWAGSFLLSFMAGQAMKVILENKGKIVFPAVGDLENPTDPLLAAILGKGGKPEIGSLPNRFKAEVDADFHPNLCREAIQAEWKRIGDVVWNEYVAHVETDGQGTKGIWDTQIQRFWDISWVCGEEGGDHTWISRRKNWRTHTPPDQEGDHCTLMGDWQELSGYSRVRDRDKRKRFWDALRKRLGELDLGDHERLCAIALIKRLYPKKSEKTIGWELDVAHWPSTPYMAAVPWIKKAHGRPEARAYLAEIKRTKIDWMFSEQHPSLKALGEFARLDGKYFHQTGLENEERFPLDEEQRKTLNCALSRVNKAVGAPASPFYAVLLMDGDRLGAMLQDSQREVSGALAKFTESVKGIVNDCDGVTIYAGGDDVLALLPLDRAIEASRELRRSYRGAFNHKSNATISAALVFVHFNLSLRAALKEAHHQLDDIAKDSNGRDSVAVSVLTGSGRTVEWASTWDESVGDDDLVLQNLLQIQREFSDRHFSSKFIYNIRARIGPLINEEGLAAAGLAIPDLLMAEYLKNREYPLKEEDAKAKELIHKLWSICRQRSRSRRRDAVGPSDVPDGSLNVNGALLVRFLTHQEVDGASIPAGTR